MTTVAISGLPVATVINPTDIIPFVQPATAGTTKSITKTKLFDSPAIATPTITNPTVTTGTFTSPALVTPTLGVATGTSLSTTGHQVISSTGKQGYATGSGGTVTQITSKATGVTLSKSTGQITLDGAALTASTTVSFTLTNTVIEAGDILIMNHISGGTAGSYLLNAQSAAGSASINVRNISLGSLSEAIVIAFAVIKAVTA